MQVLWLVIKWIDLTHFDLFTLSILMRLFELAARMG
jgi:hypothetical protein